MDFIRINLGITKIYLLPLNEGYLLLDTGYSTDYDKFVKALKCLNIELCRIKYLLLTHYHDDHAGFAARLKSELQIPLIVQKKSIPLLREGDSTGQEPEFPLTRRVALVFSAFQLIKKDFHYPPVLIDENDYVVDGDDKELLRRLGLAANILYTPGHSSDSMSVLSDDGTAFVGDAAMNYLKICGTDYRPIFYNNLDQTYRSMEKLIQAGAKEIAPAHGNIFEVEKLQRCLKRHFKI